MTERRCWDSNDLVPAALASRSPVVSETKVSTVLWVYTAVIPIVVERLFIPPEFEHLRISFIGSSIEQREKSFYARNQAEIPGSVFSVPGGTRIGAFSYVIEEGETFLVETKGYPTHWNTDWTSYNPAGGASLVALYRLTRS